jgi:outer membrane protein TolC
MLTISYSKKLSAVVMLTLLTVGGTVRADQATVQTANTPQTSASLPAHETATLPQPSVGPEKAGAPRTMSPGMGTLPASFRDRPLSITDSVALALSLNPDLVASRESLLGAHGNTRAVRSAEGLSASVSGTVSRYNTAQASNLGGQSIVTQPQNSRSVSGTISIPLDITGVLHNATSQAELQEKSSKLSISETQNTVVQTVKSAFYSVLRDRALVYVAESGLRNAQANLNDAQLRYSAGTTTRYDVVSAQSTLASSQQSLTSANTSLSTAFATLDNAIGLDIDVPLQVTTEGAVDVPDTSSVVEPSVADVIPTIQPEDALNDIKSGQSLGDSGKALVDAAQTFVVSNPSSLGSDYDGLIAEAMHKRPEVMLQDENVAAARRGIDVARKSGLPSASLGYTETYTPTASAFSSTSSGETVLSLSLPLYDSGYVSGKVTQARASLASAETTRREAIDSVELEVREAYLNVQQSLAQVRSAREELAKADEGYDLARLRYSAGVTSSSHTSPLLELSDAQNTLTTAQKDYVNALYDYNDYRNTLDKAVGRYSGASK